MKTIETKSGAIIEVWESRKEALRDLETIASDSDNFNDMGEDDTLYIAYKDGSEVFAGWNGELVGKFKKSNIKTVIYSNACTTAVYGEYKIYNIDDVDEEYSEEADDENKFWNVA